MFLVISSPVEEAQIASIHFAAPLTRKREFEGELAETIGQKPEEALVGGGKFREALSLRRGVAQKRCWEV